MNPETPKATQETPEKQEKQEEYKHKESSQRKFTTQKKKKFVRERTRIPDEVLFYLRNSVTQLPENVKLFLEKVDVTKLGWDPYGLQKIYDFHKPNIIKILHELGYDTKRKLRQVPKISPGVTQPLPKLAPRQSPLPLSKQEAEKPKIPVRSATSLGLGANQEKQNKDINTLKMKLWSWELPMNKVQDQEKKKTGNETPHSNSKQDEKDKKEEIKMTPEEEKLHEEKKTKLRNLLLRTQQKMAKEFEYWSEIFKAAELQDADAECIAELCQEDQVSRISCLWTAEELEASRLCLSSHHRLISEQERLTQRISELDALTKKEVIMQKLEKAKSREIKTKCLYPYFSEYVEKSSQKYITFQKLLTKFLNESKASLLSPNILMISSGEQSHLGTPTSTATTATSIPPIAQVQTQSNQP
jgi:hypothetical protein